MSTGRQPASASSVACCGVLCALAVVIMLAGSLIWVGTYAAPLLAVWILLPVQSLFGNFSGG